MSRKIVRCRESTGDYAPLLRLWCLRALATPTLQTQISRRRLADDAIVQLLEIEELPENPKTVKALFADKLKKSEVTTPAMRGLLFDNLAVLAEQLGLTELDREILALVVLSRLEEALHDTLEQAGKLTDPRFDRLVATVLGREFGEVAEAMSPGGRLAATKLVVPGRSVATFEDKVTIKDELPHALSRRNDSLDDLLSFAAVRASAPQLARSDYAHLARHVEILIPYLRHAIGKRQRGVNVLLYGGPGNGKTELAKVLARELDLMLYEVRYADDDGDPASPVGRISSYTLMQAILCRQQRSAILFDEIEDIFPQGAGTWDKEDRESQRRKAWLNRTLEGNPVPAFWIGNTVSHVDPAFLRRFDYVIELGPPPRSVRCRMLRARLEGLPVSEGWLERKADEPALTPGIVAKLAQVLELDKGRDRTAVESRFDLMAEARLAAQGDAFGCGRYPFPARYRVELLNASVDPLAVARRLGERRQGSALLYGPPGTGKTAYAHFIARHLDRPLLVKRASDLLSKWLGETEQLINGMFREAAADNAVLLLDEADSFLQDRRQAQRSWEITQVNELLTRMEEFEGIFLCATNFADNLDPAAMRRFALKVRFDPLKRDQARAFLADALQELAIEATDEVEQQRIWRELDALNALTAGDFAAAKKAVDLDAFGRSARGLVDALRTEIAARPEACRRPIGFAA